MYKGSSNLLSVLVLLPIAFAASSDTNISFVVGEFNEKVTYLQERLDQFEYITEGNVSMLLQRVEEKELDCAENATLQINDANVKLNNLVDKMDSGDTKLNALEGKLDALETTASTNMSTLLLQVEGMESKCTEHVTQQIKETNEKLNALDKKLDALRTRFTYIVEELVDLIRQSREYK